MRSDDFYRAKAAECELKAAKAPDDTSRLRWQKTAADWRALLQTEDKRRRN